ncbi:hypothetical protein [Saccharophagus degradans]|uniref:Uncharacterized protein n=1 Tax=Saccharophagus degradans TaxID=86304 RepID=A0AAW7X6A3_9GAMM|nr:hypothetical protein [Saccharophagus degradans]MDO6422281.1 hypothetical protein [Saccharophagus degradans]MDO6607444.1 hypothetical protein [Saccharophagus degradans]
MKYFVSLIFSMAFCLNGHTNEQTLLFYSNIQSTVSFRGWDTKGSGDIVEESLISVIISNNWIGDVVVIRNIKTTDIREPILKEEAYKPTPATDVWALDYQTTQRTLIKQANNTFLITERIEGENGGLRMEFFRLSESEPDVLKPPAIKKN